MPENRTYTYEAMFLLGQAAAADLTGSLAHIHEIFRRNQCEVLAMKKWDERRLAYEIKKQKRGLYILAYFRAPAGNMAHFERDCNLSEKLLRTMVLRADHLSLDEIKAADGRDALETEAKMRASQIREKPADQAEPVAASTESAAQPDDQA
ncbi:30S ribosomal protein S6 [Leptolyngbya sp. 15MV]|nr:30S ribosomal protein S6 [Leptolyngbya sp. 15MV]